MNKFEIENLELFYGDFKALKNINMNISQSMKLPHLSGQADVENRHF